MSEVNEVPTYKAPEGVNGPTLGRDLPDGCERLRASIYPAKADGWWDGPGVTNDCLYWWRPVIPPSREQRDHIAKMAAIGRAVAAAKRLHPSAGVVA